MAGLKNGELLARAVGQYDVLLTMDANLSFQQYLATLRIAVVVLKVASNRLADTRPLMRNIAGGGGAEPAEHDRAALLCSFRIQQTPLLVLSF